MYHDATTMIFESRIDQNYFTHVIRILFFVPYKTVFNNFYIHLSSKCDEAVENPKPGGRYVHIVKERLKIAVRFQHSFCYHDAILFMVAFLCAAFVLRNSTGGSFWFEYATLGFDSHSAWDSRLDLFNMQLRWLPFLQLYKQFHFQLIFLNLFLPTESYRTYAVQVRILCSFVQTQEVKRSSYQAAYGRSAIPVSSLWSGIF